MDSRALQRHLEEEHGRSGYNTLILALVYGGMCGALLSLAVLVGFASYLGFTWPIREAMMIQAMLMALLAGALAVAMSGFLAERAQARLVVRERAKEAHEIKHNRAMERAETLELLRMRGVSEADAQSMTEVLERNPRLWVDFMMRYELEMEEPSDMRPLRAAFIRFAACLGVGLVPLAPVALQVLPQTGLWLGIGLAVLMVSLSAWLRAKLAKDGPGPYLTEALGAALLAAVFAWGFGGLF